MNLAIIDTSVYIADVERGLADLTVASLRRTYLVRHSAVVLSELRRAARSEAGQQWVAGLAQATTQTWAPTSADWWEAGRLIRDIGDASDWNTGKRRDFQNDALIALTGRRYGATIITQDRADFERLAGRLKVRVRFL